MAYGAVPEAVAVSSAARLRAGPGQCCSILSSELGEAARPGGMGPRVREHLHAFDALLRVQNLRLVLAFGDYCVARINNESRDQIPTVHFLGDF